MGETPWRFKSSLRHQHLVNLFIGKPASRSDFCGFSLMSAYLIWLTLKRCEPIILALVVAGWSSLVARRAHNP